MAKQKLDVKAFGLSAGIIWGAAVFLTGLAAMQGYAVEFMNLIASVYPGYTATFGGSVIGGIIGFVDMGVGGVIFAWLYNKLAK